MAIVLERSRSVPTGVIPYADAFGIRAPFAEPWERVYGSERRILHASGGP
jgi:hypothetical protein